MLIPREHGAYGQLLMPLVAACAVGRPSAASLSVAALAVSAFLAHEPLLVLLGQRGLRAARDQRTEARRSLILFGIAALAAGVLAVAVLPAPARAASVVPIGLATVAARLVATGRERTTIGEILVAVTLTAASLPTAIAGGASTRAAVTLTAVFSAAFASATLAVRAVIAHSTGSSHGPSRRVGATVIMVLWLVLARLATLGLVASVAPWAAAPVFALALLLLASAPSSQHLRVVGWALVGATAVTAVVLIAALR